MRLEVRHWLVFSILKRLQRGDAFWTPPRSSREFRMLCSAYRIETLRAKSDAAINERSIYDRFIRDLSALRMRQVADAAEKLGMPLDRPRNN